MDKIEVGTRIVCQFLGSQEKGVVTKIHEGGVFASVKLDSGCGTLKDIRCLRRS